MRFPGGSQACGGFAGAFFHHFGEVGNILVAGKPGGFLDAAALQQQALACHDALEAHYKAAVDFSQVDAAREALAQKLGLAGPPAL